ncbi:glycosyltransferase family 4 protein [Dolichospermum circinale]|uniref:glycosyltransferase family 4 protein n=1 Tax=Dolichospermum circinale TaxID=109265 RepID=UPI0023313C8E|nr:glycosyltransferase family 4 protein [Dolichospermum circinale]MDB9451313.1 glycosyltransferase family 4 protein [Dolichospermum circinale CS-547]
MSKSRVAVAQLGARKHYQEPLLFHKWGILDSLYTDFYAGNSPMISLLKPTGIFNKLPNTLKKALDRYDPELNLAKIIDFPTFGYQYAQKLRNAKGEGLSSIFIWAAQEFSKRILERGLGSANIIYGFNGASLELFQFAKQKGIRCILDQTLAERSLVHQLLLEEENLWQGWSNSPFNVSDSNLALAQREQQEQDLADHIICGSQFVKDSLIARGVDDSKISVIALGRIKESQSSQENSRRISAKERGDGLRILFAGEVGLRKGIPYLLDALKQLQGKVPFSCKIAGGIGIKPEYVADYSDVCDFLGRVPRSQMLELYRWADVFVLPSICEGSAMVTYEALNWGLPVITTHNAGSIIRDSIDGYIVPIRCTNSITDQLIHIFNCSLPKKISQTDLIKFYQESENKLRFAITTSPA